MKRFHKYMIDPVRSEAELIELIADLRPEGNMRYLRHIVRLKIKIGNMDGNVASLTEKQLSTLIHARAQQRVKLKLIEEGRPSP